MIAGPRGGFRWTCLLLASLLVGLTGPAAGSDDDPQPMREEDVVRMYVTGESVDEILALIRDRPGEYDVSEEMLEELRLAGIPKELIRAMQKRQAEQDGVSSADGPSAGDAKIDPTRARLRVVLVPPGEDDDGALPPLSLPAGQFPPALAEQHGLGSNPQDRTLEDLAVFLACRSAQHVPDLWRTKSPMGRDFVSMPRHGILAFHSGARAVDIAKASRITRRLAPGSDTLLELELPAELTADVEPGLTHDLLLGIAGRIGDRWLVLEIAERDGIEVPAQGATLAASVWSLIKTTGPSLGARFVEEATGDASR